MSGGTRASDDRSAGHDRCVDGGESLNPAFDGRGLLQALPRSIDGPRPTSARDLPASTLDAPGLQAMRQPEQERDGGSFGPLTNQAGADDRDAHQRVHVEAKMTNRCQRAWPHRPQADER